MIIGNNNSNNNFSNRTFTNKFNQINKEHELNKDKVNINQEDKKAFNYGDSTNKNQMADKSFAMLQDRYNKGLISLEEFTKKCNQLAKQRRN